MAQTVCDLEALGFIARRPDPSDGRRVLVELTELGHETLVEERRKRDGWLAGAIAGDLSSEDQEVLQRALVLLRRLADA
jgi:DNA-binding MarR family transcriptional regulator